MKYWAFDVAHLWPWRQRGGLRGQQSGDDFLAACDEDFLPLFHRREQAREMSFCFVCGDGLHGWKSRRRLYLVK